MCRKFAEVLRNEGHLPKYLEGLPQLQRIVAYEMMRNLLAQPFNCYSWNAPGIDPPSLIAEYNDFRHRRLGQFFTSVAQLLLSLPDDMQTKKDLDKMCATISAIGNDYADMDTRGQEYEPVVFGMDQVPS